MRKGEPCSERERGFTHVLILLCYRTYVGASHCIVIFKRMNRNSIISDSKKDSLLVMRM